ncbi:MAG: NUDIX hydrolase [Candidatus Micrarchaeaceae archaeon]
MANGYKASTFKVRTLRFRSRGVNVEYAYVDDADIAVTLPLFDDGRILFEKIYRRAIKKWLYELPGGHINPGEDPKKAAARELEEETGYKATSIEPLFDAYEAPGVGKHHIHVFVATGLSKGKTNLDPDEFIETKAMALENAVKLVMEARNTDAKTIAGILLYYLKGKRCTEEKMNKKSAGKSRIIFKGKAFMVGSKQLHMHNEKLDYATVLVGKSAAIIPVTDDGKILLERNYRQTVNKWIYEIPAGHVEKGEPPIQCAARELEEETGYRASNISLLYKGLTSPGISDEEIYIFVGKGLKPGRMNREPFEKIKLLQVTIGEAMKLIEKSKSDLKTYAAIMALARSKNQIAR